MNILLRVSKHPFKDPWSLVLFPASRIECPATSGAFPGFTGFYYDDVLYYTETPVADLLQACSRKVALVGENRWI